jgi:toxin ParE1/3/4
MPEPTVLPAAQDDLSDIYVHLYQYDPSTAERHAREFDRRLHVLAQRPHLGQASHYAPHLRRFAMRRYIIFYRPTTESIEIVRVLHGARDMGQAFIDSHR